MTLRHDGSTPDEVAHMDFIDPASLIRKKGNLKISLTIDAPLQKALEELVNERGYQPMQWFPPISGSPPTIP